MPNNIETLLTNLFERHRIVFWYDSKKELRGDFESIEIDGVNKKEINNNEFGLKHLILREKPKAKFLLYKEDAEPVNPIDNWLLDVQLAHHVFSADQSTIWLEELGLGPEYRELINNHSEFFKDGSRRKKLTKLLNNNETQFHVKLKMLSVCSKSNEAGLDPVLEYLLKEFSEDKENKINLIKRCHLDEFLFNQIRESFQYQSDEPSIKDFCIELFKSCYARKTGKDSNLSQQSEIFINRWKDSRTFEKSFNKLSALCSDTLSIENDLNTRDYIDLLDIDYFEIIDRKIITELVNEVINKTISAGKVSKHVHKRTSKHFYKKYKDLYKATENAAQFFLLIEKTNLEIKSFNEGIELYSSTWYRIDQLYRKYIFHMQISHNPSLMSDLTERVENLYSNKYLLELNNHWQLCVNDVEHWGNSTVSMQRNFFADFVKPYIDSNNKICVIISDALRYEIGSELVTKINRENRFKASISPVLSMLPSYTQLGMAALLPNQDLEIVNDDSSTVEVDGISSSGIKNRNKILNNVTDLHASCIKADEFRKLNGNERKSLFSNNQVLYVYHNLIDQTGDKRESEERVFKVANDTLDDIIQIMKTLSNVGASNLLITADHGFIYQNRELPESDFSSVKVEANKTLFKNRRFVIGNGFKKNDSFKVFKSSELGLSGDVEVAIPNSITRFRQKGSGSRFVHGGASLQEVVIPLIKVNKSRTSDLTKVDVEVIGGPSQSTITTSQFKIVLYQSEAVSDKNLARTLRVGVYTKDNKLISDRHEFLFNFSSTNSREREIPVQLILTREVNDMNNQDVELRLEERETGSTHYKIYDKKIYTLRLSFKTDFDL